MAEFSKRRLFGLDFLTGTTIPEIAEALLAANAEGAGAADQWRCVVTPNVDHLVRYDRFPAERAVAERSFLVLPDGMPIIWASRLLRRPLDRRLAGSDLFAHLWPILAARRTPTVLVAPSQQVADLLTVQHPDLAAVVAPLFDVDDEVTITQLVDDIVSAVDTAGATLVFIAISMAKHHLLAARLHQRWAPDFRNAPTVLLVGASPEFHLGLAKRAPKWMQRVGLEWLHRLLQDPRRMSKRYLVDDTHFARLVWRELRRGSSAP